MDTENKGILVLKNPDEKREIEFEVEYLLSLPIAQRFFLMQQKSLELKTNLEKNGHRRTPQIIKRK
jgi:hypothetical protein